MCRNVPKRADTKWHVTELCQMAHLILRKKDKVKHFDKKTEKKK